MYTTQLCWHPSKTNVFEALPSSCKNNKIVRPDAAGREGSTGSEYLINNRHETKQGQCLDKGNITTLMLTRWWNWGIDRYSGGNQ